MKVKVLPVTKVLVTLRSAFSFEWFTMVVLWRSTFPHACRQNRVCRPERFVTPKLSSKRCDGLLEVLRCPHVQWNLQRKAGVVLLSLEEAECSGAPLMIWSGAGGVQSESSSRCFPSVNRALSLKQSLARTVFFDNWREKPTMFS